MNTGKQKLSIKIIASVTLATAAAIFVIAGKISFIRINFVSNGSVNAARARFAEENFGHPRLKHLKVSERLDEVGAGGKTQFEKIIFLRAWARRQWEPAPDGKFRYPAWDAAEILRLARKGNRGFCAQYAIVFVQAALALGIHARYIDLPGHFATAVWSDDYGRWVVMDPSKDIHFEKDGLPMRGRDLCRAAWAGDTKNIRKVFSDGKTEPATADDVAPYKLYSILLRNNHLDEPAALEVNGRKEILTPGRPISELPLVGKDTIVISDRFLAWREPKAKKLFKDRTATDETDEFDRPQNQTVIDIAASYPSSGAVKIRLDTENSPTFEQFLVRTSSDDNYSPAKDKLYLRLKPGANEIRARILTRAGWLGPESRVKLFYKPRWF